MVTATLSIVMGYLCIAPIKRQTDRASRELPAQSTLD